jgi:hypothetical protein
MNFWGQDAGGEELTVAMPSAPSSGQLLVVAVPGIRGECGLRPSKRLSKVA